MPPMPVTRQDHVEATTLDLCYSGCSEVVYTRIRASLHLQSSGKQAQCSQDWGIELNVASTEQKQEDLKLCFGRMVVLLKH